ncbi:helix-hairpin-helix domain-containing protein [Virgibacillus sp. NKC19-16]|uniref:helix-hairpin-helix domain-containing protein n=1 Tax=Virgibacillus salidurans TaxID=2831673 RepID=UPI001F334D73|nr:helix-hairpin-helix domain-containing protein [Virgibacillus sp. NKC19-16]UJL44898.1 helix-hairpin-helix domain-containing protein [Virgibacillus sp. NKC19-16]
MVDLLKKGAFFIAIAGIVGIFLFLTRDDSVEESETEFDTITSSLDVAAEQDNADVQNETIAIVDVKGAVTTPGVYEMDSQSRVNDVIQTAGGFTEDADQTQVNLAQKVQDEMIIIIPKEGEEANGGGSGSSESGKVKINQATQAEMESLNGIGPSKAQAIIQYRDEHGLFQTEEDLLEISGIGEKTLDNFRDDIQIP